MNTTTITRFLETTTWPSFLSSDVRIREEGGALIIEHSPLPMTLIRWWMGFMLILGLGLVAWLRPDDLWLVATMGPLSVVGFLVFMSWIDRQRKQAGPLSVIGSDIRNRTGATMPRTTLKRLVEVYYTTTDTGNMSNYRVILIDDGHQYFPILWQMATRSSWTRPSLDDLAQRLGVPSESIDLPEKIDPPKQR